VSEPLYRRLLGARFDVLPACVRALHDVGAASTWRGRASVRRGRTGVSRLVARLASLPPDGADQELLVTFRARASREIWSRRFGSHHYFCSIQYARRGMLNERVGPSTLLFTPITCAHGLALRLDGFRLLGIPLPGLLHPKIQTLEREHAGRYHFEVEATLPAFGLLVAYAGWLEPVGETAAQ